MKHLLTVIIIHFWILASIGQTINYSTKDAEGKTKLLGKINKEGLSQAPFNDWFSKNYANYSVDKTLAKSIKKELNSYSIKVFLGTWCSDSKRQVPRLYKVLEAIDFPKEQLEVYALDNSKTAYKQSPNGEEKGLNIHHVPTFIFYKNGEEINRIIESPKVTFENDISAILKGDYRSNYHIANYVHTLLQDHEIHELKAMEPHLLPQLLEYVKGSRELNALGYVKLRNGNVDAAIYIFDLNVKMFPYKSQVYNSIAEAYYINKNYHDALKNYNTVLSMTPKDKNAKKMIRVLRKLLK
ncbi:MAG: hypothetical protein HRT67_10245 [Flavobacteriaceae bacterium]|nr:hypothetical protein [Flavobacteriaceae bacterium]